MAFFRKLAGNGDENTEDEEAAGRKQEDDDGIHEIGEDRDTKHGTGTQQFTNDTHGEQCGSKTNAHANAIDDGGQNLVLAGVHFGTAENDAVNNDQRQENAQGSVQIREVSLNEHLHDGNETGDDGDKSGDTNLVRNDIAEKGNNSIGTDQNQRSGQAHTNGI